MGDWGIISGQRFETIGVDAANSRGTNITGDASANTKGSWVELVASSAFDVKGIWIDIGFGSLADFLVDIGVGAEGSEQVIISNLYATPGATSGTALRSATTYCLPISIPVGTRISARSQSTGTGLGIRLTVTLMGLGFASPQPLSRMTTYGAATGDSGGTSIDPGATIQTKGAWVEIIGSSTNKMSALALAIGNQNNAARLSASWLFDISVGAATSEVILIPDLFLASNASGDMVFPITMGTFPVHVPRGTRIAARAQCSINDATDRLFDLILYGID